MDDDLESMKVGDLRDMADAEGIPWRDEDGRVYRKPELVERLMAGRITPLERPMPPATTVEAAKEAPPEAPARQHYKVMQTARLAINGRIFKLNQGSVISEATHDIKAARAQGVVLEECDPYTAPVDAYGNRRGREFGPPDSLPRQIDLAGHRDGSRISPEDGSLEPPEEADPLPDRNATVEG